MASKTNGYLLLLAITVMNSLAKDCKETNVPVVEFITSPDTSTLSNEEIIQANLKTTNEITFCFRFMNQNRRPYNLIVTDQLRIWFENDKFFNIFVYLIPFNTTSATQMQSRMFPFCKHYTPDHWVSVCFNIKLYQDIQDINFVQDGKSCFRTKFSGGNFDWFYLHETVRFHEIVNSNVLDQPKLPHGKITRFYLWNRSLENEEMMRITSNCSHEVNTTGMISNWDNLTNKSINPHTMTIRYSCLESICQNNEKATILVAINLEFDDAKELCSHLGGEMPLKMDMDESSIKYSIGNRSSCSRLKNFAYKEFNVWLPIRLESYASNNLYKWVNDNDSQNKSETEDQKWAESQPNGMGIDKCAVDYLNKDLWYDTKCEYLFCSLCTVPTVQTYLLRGYTEKGLDHEYSLALETQKYNSKIIFRGKSFSKIVWHPIEKKAQIFQGEDTTIITLDQNPFGGFAQVITQSKTKKWKFTNCQPDKQFTCWNGACVSILKRCDKKMDCKDGSDEYKCSYIKIDDDKYRKNIVPVKQVGNYQLEVKVGIEVIDIVEINEPQNFFSLKFNLWLIWKDDRLGFQNLKSHHFQNEISGEVIDRLWKPQLVYANSNEKSLKRRMLMYDPLSSTLMAQRGRGKGIEAPLTQVDEAIVYSSNETELLWRTDVFSAFNCHFDMRYFPFDHQSCYVELKVPETDEDQVQLIPGKLKLSYKSSHNKFEVKNCLMEVKGNNAILLLVNLERLSSPFWMSLFIPSICLILAAEVTLFLDKSHFEAMIMVSLTSNLVMFTLYSSIQEKLPEDSSFKLIDVWLMHGLLMPMVVFVVLVADELLNPRYSTTKIKKKSKVANSFVQAPKKGEVEMVCESKKNINMAVFKTLIPIMSIIFMTTFFVICLYIQQV